MRNRTNFTERIVKGMCLTNETAPIFPLAEILGDHRVLIENHFGVVKYCGSEIKARVRFGYFCVQGQELKILHLTKERLVIGGCINGITLIRKGE